MAEKKTGFDISYLPAPTWNRLGVNKAYIDTKIFDNYKNEDIYSEKNTENIKVENLNRAETEKLIDSFSKDIEREKYIAGKKAIYAQQAFSTGLGKDYTDFIDENLEESRIFTIEENAQITKPVIIKWEFKKGSKGIYQNVIHAKKNSSSTFLMVYSSCPQRDAEGALAFETKIIIEDGATVNIMKVNLLGDAFLLLDDTGALLNSKSVFNFTQMQLGAAKVYTGCYANQKGDKSLFDINAGYMATQEHSLDINYVACQRGQKTESKILVKGALRDKASKTFKGTIDFRNGAKASKGDEREDVLILSDDVVNKTVPVILTEEEDVDGHHGATIGNLSADTLYYLATRGIDKKSAQMLMTRGRLLEIAHTIPDEETVERISTFIEGAFKTNE